MYPNVIQLETKALWIEEQLLLAEPEHAARARCLRKRGGGMWSYWAYADEHRARLLEWERAARRRLIYEEALEDRRRSLRERIDASRMLLSRRERRLLAQNSVVLTVSEGDELAAPRWLVPRQFFLLERGRARLSVGGAVAGSLAPGDVVAHASGVGIRAETDLRVRVLTPREFAAVRTIPALGERLVEPLPAAA